jgi:hypothetical protein
VYLYWLICVFGTFIHPFKGIVMALGDLGHFYTLYTGERIPPIEDHAYTLYIYSYTSAVEQYMPLIVCALKDPARIVRQQTLTLLTSLLKEDFVRWQGMLLYRCVIVL